MDTPPTTLIHLATVADAGAVADIYGPIVRDMMISFEESVPNASDMADRIEDTLSFAPWLVCEIDGTVVGYTYARKFKERAAYRWAVELSTYLAEGFRGKRVGRSLVASLLAALKVQGFVQALGIIALPNPASVRMFKSFGARHIGTQKNVGYKAGQ
jgi:L-amino acid N-acyltransferase YncA